MSEETVAAEAAPQDQGAGVDPVAIALALGGASQERADAFLTKQEAFIDDQRRLTALQIEKLATQEHFEQSHLHWRRFNERMKGALQILAVLMGLAVISGLSVMVWNAAHAEGYVIESFSVPPDLAVRGLTGEVVAGRFLDRLNVVQTPPQGVISFAQNLSTSASDDVRVEIPETGISLGELYRFLRRWLGREIHVSGEVTRQDTNLAVAVRIDGKDGALFDGQESDLETLIQKAAEHVFDRAYPARYASWLRSLAPAREAEAASVYHRVIADAAASPLQRASAWNGLGSASREAGDTRQALTFYRKALEVAPDFALSSRNAVLSEFQLSHPETALAQLPQALAVLEGNHEGWSPAAFAAGRAQFRATDAELRGDFARAIAEWQTIARGSYQPYSATLLTAVARARLHDGDALAWLAEQRQLTASPSLRAGPASAASGRTVLAQPILTEAALQHWPKVIAMAAEAEKNQPPAGFSENGRELFAAVSLRPWVALAKARTGDVAGAEALIATTPGDCYDCVRIRGLIASEAKQWDRADHWFAKVVQDAPSIPFAYEDWGRSLLVRGKPDEAIAQFQLANKKGPHFADALEGWGEALMVKNQSHIALAKFAEAEKYAPNWGRLHLKWGQALAYSGRKTEAAKHLTRAAQLDLTPSEKAVLAGKK